MREVESLLQEINNDAKQMLSEKRYIHSIGVMKKAEELAKRYSIDADKAKLTGLAHDIAKEMPKEEMLKYIKEHNIEVDKFETEHMGLLHGKIGAEYCKEKYDFSEDMQKAIKYHTTGRPEMDDLAKIIFIADKTEEGRTHIDFEKVAEKEKEGLNSLLLYVLNNSILYIIEKEKTMHLDTVITRNYFLSQIKKQKQE